MAVVWVHQIADYNWVEALPKRQTTSSKRTGVPDRTLGRGQSNGRMVCEGGQRTPGCLVSGPATQEVAEK